MSRDIGKNYPDEKLRVFFLEGNHRSPKSLQVKCGKYKCIHVNDDCCATECAITLCKIFSFRKKNIFGEYWFSFSISWKTISVLKLR